MNWLKKLRVHLRPYLLLAAIVIATAKQGGTLNEKSKQCQKNKENKK